MRFIIDFVNYATIEQINAYFATHECRVVETLDRLGATFVIEAESTPSQTGLVEHLMRDDLAVVELLGETKTFEIDDDDNWWKIAVVRDIDYSKEQCTLIRTGAGQRVYVMDSGIDAQHPDFRDKSIDLLWSKTGDFTDTTGHGTAVASVIIGEACGITEATLKVIKVFEKGSPTLVSEILAGLNAVAADFDQDPSRAAVLNCSWAITRNAFVEAKILALIARGVVVVAAAGNSGIAVQDVTPAALAEVITVGAFSQDLEACDFSNYSNPNDTSLTQGATNTGSLDCFAPGELIRVALPGGGFGYSAGTSIAAAISSAVFAANLAVLNGSFQDLSYETTLTVLKGSFVTADLLELRGPYWFSPNRIPVASLKLCDPIGDPPPRPRPFAVSEHNRTLRRRVFDANAYGTAWVTGGNIPAALEENWIVIDLPAVESRAFYVIDLMLWREGSAETIQYVVTSFNPEAYPDPKAAMQDSDYAALDCNCGSAGFCCGSCDPKTQVCSQCPFFSPSEGFYCP